MRLPMSLSCAILVTALVACRGAPSSAPATLTPVQITIRDVMGSVIDPSADALFESIQDIADSHGITHKAPHSDADWALVQQHLQVLSSAADALRTPGLAAARPEQRSAFPDIENQPEEVQALLGLHHDDFVRRTDALQQAAQAGLAAVDARNTPALAAAIGHIDQACEACHLQFWYPKDQRARQAAREEGLMP